MGSVDSPYVLESTLETLIRRARIPRTYQAALLRRFSSLFNQPVTLSVFSGSGPLQSKHWNVRCPLPPGGSARIKNVVRPAKHGRSGCTWPQANHNAVYLKSASAAKKAVKKVGNSRKRVEKRLKRRYAV